MVIGPYSLIVLSLDAKMRYPPGGRVEYRAVWRSHKRPKGWYPMYKTELIKVMVKKAESIMCR